MTPRAPGSIALLALALVSQAGCAGQGVNTEVVVEVDAEPLVREMARTLVVRVWSGRRNGPIPQTIELDQPLPVFGPEGRWPRTVLLTPRTRGDAESFYRFEASAYAEASPDPETDIPVATVRLISGYGRDQTIHVRLLLQDACIGRECGEDETCDRDRCVPAQIDDITMFDGGPVAMDAGVPRDGDVGDAGCTAGGCDDDNECTLDTCLGDGTCANEPDVGRGCVGVGAFCDGTDTCDATGTCVASGMDPCLPPTTCDEDVDRCVGCTTSSDCPAGTAEYGDCEPGAGVCPTSGTRRGIVPTFTCVERVCTATGMMAATPMVCAYDSEGFACDGPDHCASASCNATGACVAAPSSCDAGVPDAGPPDAGPIDAGIDSGLDSGIDAGQDAGFDAGHDAGFGPGFDSGFMMTLPDGAVSVDEL